jgi:hypothetical protein
VRSYSRSGLLRYKIGPQIPTIRPIPSFRHRPESRGGGPVRSYNLVLTYPCQGPRAPRGDPLCRQPRIGPPYTGPPGPGGSTNTVILTPVPPPVNEVWALAAPSSHSVPGRCSCQTCPRTGPRRRGYFPPAAGRSSGSPLPPCQSRLVNVNSLQPGVSVTSPLTDHVQYVTH